MTKISCITLFLKSNIFVKHSWHYKVQSWAYDSLWAVYGL